MKNKQIISVLLCIALALSLFCSCGKKEKAEKFEQKLRELNKTKAEWLNEKIDEELKE